MSPISSRKSVPPVALLELADALRQRAGEGAFFVAEEFAFEQVFGDRRAVDGDERLVHAGAVLENGAGDEFLAGAAFAGDQDGRAGRRDLADELVNLLHCGRIADDGLAAFLRVKLGGKGDDLFHRAGGGERLEKQVLQLGNVEGLEHVIVGPALHRLDGRLRGAVGRHHDHDLLRVDLAQFLERVETALLAHADVHHDQVGHRFTGHTDALVARLGALDFERFLLQQPAKGIMDVLLVVDDEDGLLCFR